MKRKYLCNLIISIFFLMSILINVQVVNASENAIGIVTITDKLLCTDGTGETYVIQSGLQRNFESYIYPGTTYKFEDNDEIGVASITPSVTGTYDGSGSLQIDFIYKVNRDKFEDIIMMDEDYSFNGSGSDYISEYYPSYYDISVYDVSGKPIEGFTFKRKNNDSLESIVSNQNGQACIGTWNDSGVEIITYHTVCGYVPESKNKDEFGNSLGTIYYHMATDENANSPLYIYDKNNSLIATISAKQYDKSILKYDNSMELTNDYFNIDYAQNNYDVTITSNKENASAYFDINEIGAYEGQAIYVTVQELEQNKIHTNNDPDEDEINVNIQSITLDTQSLELQVGDNDDIYVGIVPINATNTKLEWESDNTNVASVDQNGCVTGISEGNAVITVRTMDGSGIVAQCSITVTPEDDSEVDDSEVDDSEVDDSEIDDSKIDNNNDTYLVDLLDKTTYDAQFGNWYFKTINTQPNSDITIGITNIDDYIKNITSENKTYKYVWTRTDYKSVEDWSVNYKEDTDSVKEDMDTPQITVNIGDYKKTYEFSIYDETDSDESLVSVFFDIAPNGNWDFGFYATDTDMECKEPESLDEAYVSCTIDAGETASFTLNAKVFAAGNTSPTLSYHWYQVNNNDELILIDGATDNTLRLSNLSTSTTYELVAQDEYGNMQIHAFFININTGLKVEEEELDEEMTVNKGETATLQVHATAMDTVKISYQWYMYEDYSWKIIDGANGASYTTSAITKDVQYKCIVTDSYDNQESVWFTITAGAETSGTGTTSTETSSTEKTTETPSTETPTTEKTTTETSVVNNSTTGKTTTDKASAETQLPSVGSTETVSGSTYKVTKSTADTKEVTYTAPTNKKKTSIKVPDTVNIDGQTYKVTAIADKAFKNNSKLKSVTIGKNITKIGKEAFSGCKKLSKITVKSTKLKTVGKNAIKGINKKATIKVPKTQLSKYKKLFKSKTGFKKSMKIKK